MKPAKSPRQKNLRDTSSEFFISTCKDLFLRNKDRQIIGFSFDGSFCRRLLIMDRYWYVEGTLEKHA